METFVYLGVLINAVLIAAGGVVVIAIWYGMRALVKMANSVARMAEAVERIEETIRSREKERV
jgi:hypothetical protein